MKIFLLLFTVLFLYSPVGSAQEIDPPAATIKTLKEAFSHALKNSERIAISDQLVRQAQALYRSAIGSSLPEFLYSASTSLEDGEDTENDGSFRLSQEGLNGYRQLAAIRAGKSTVEQRIHERQRAEQLLLADIAVAFYGLLQAQANVAATQRLTELAQERLKELQDRVRVGRTRKADAVGQEFQITTLESQLEESMRLVDSRKNLLNFLVGTPAVAPQATDEVSPAAQPLLDEYLARLERRPDVQAIRKSVDAAQGRVAVERSDYLPELDITANYYTHRPDSLEDVEWDAVFNVDVPLWAWGERRAGVAVAQSERRRLEETLSAARRQAELEIRTAHRDYLAARKQLDLQQTALELAKRDYEFQVEDDRQGLVTSLEVIESLNRLNSAELAFNNAQLQERLAALNLEIAAGATPGEILQ